MLGELGRIGGPRDAEVGNLQHAVLAQEEVRGLDVAMDEAGVMRVLQACRSLYDEADRFGVRQFAAGGQRRARHVLHHDEEAAASFTRVVDPHDVRVGQPAREPGLAKETRANALVGSELLGEDLDRHRPLQLLVAREIDHSHRATSECVLDPVPAVGDCLVQSWPSCLCLPLPFFSPGPRTSSAGAGAQRMRVARSVTALASGS